MAVQTQILHRRGTAATWTSTNPTLGAGEIGYETDTGKYKIGTGSTAWTALAYSSILPTTVTAKGDLITATANNTPARLGVGANNTVLTADSAEATGMKWVAPVMGMSNPMTTTGDIIYASSGSTPARLAIGTTGQVLTVAGGVPSYATPASGGGMTQLASGSLSGVTTTISSISGSYKDLQLVLRNIKSTYDGTGISYRFNSDASAKYAYTDIIDVVSSSTGNNEAQFGGGADNTVTGGITILNIYDYANTSTFKYAIATNLNINDITTTNVGMSIKQTAYASTSAVTAISIIPNAGTLSGTYVLYGVN